MKIILSKRGRALTYTLVTMLILVCALFGLLQYQRQDQQSKIDRSNAMQVTKQVQNEIIPAASPDFFTEYRLEREKNRSERSDLLREIIKNTNSEELRQRAQDNMLKLVVDKQREAEIESLIKSKGFNDSLVFIRDNSVSAIVKANSLTKEEVIVVADVINRVSGVSAENITISAKP